MIQIGLAIGIAVGAAVVALGGGVGLGIWLRKTSSEKKIGSAEEQARKLLEEAIRNAESAKKEAIISAKDEIF